MGMFTKGIKKAIESQTSKIKPSKDINPLVKQTEDIFKSPDQVGDPMLDDTISLLSDTNQKYVDEEKIGFEKEEIVGRLYSPVYSAIENMAIGKGGTKGENISAYLRKRAPNVDKTELESFDINLDPKRLYTKEEVLDLAKEKGSTDYTIEKQQFPEYRDSQRQDVMDAEEDYLELTVEGKQKYTESSSAVHLGRKSNIGHSRSSIRREAPTQLQQKIVDRPRYLLIEEIQSDLAKRRGEDGYLTGIEFNPDEEDYDQLIGSFEDESMYVGINYNVYTNPNVEEIIRLDITNNFSPYNVNTVDDIKLINEDETYIGLFKDKIEKQTGKRPEGNTLIKAARNALIDNSDFSDAKVDDALVNAQGSADPEGQFVNDIDRLFNQLSEKLVNVYSGQKENTASIQKIPVDSRSGYVRKLILANIAYAKRNGIDKIVIPNPREIAKKRIETFDSVLASDQQIFKAYEKARKKKGFNYDEYATDYFEKIFKPLYKDSVTKVLNTLKSETKGKIKYGTKELKYRGPYKEDAQGRLTNTRLPYKADAIEIDITDFEFNPEAQSLRFNEGGAVPMQEQMKIFNEGGLKDEGGSVDPVSGNDVPIGSTQEEVRDDVPAMLSEGEFVFPADVVRYIGLEKLMQLRQDAKMGLKKMEAMGQMGNSEEATLPDDMPFSMADIVIVEGPDEPKEMARGGVIRAQTGTFVTPIFDPKEKDMRPYTNDGGKTIRYIPFLNNSPVYPIPSGYVPLDQATAAPEETPEEVAPTESGGGGGRNREPFRSEFQKAGGWDMDFGDPPDPKKVELWIKEAEKVSTVGNIATGIVSAINPVVGIATHLGTKLNKKGILDNAETVRGIASEDQLERINNVTERLTDPQRKGILSKILGGVVDEIGDALGLSKQEQDVVKTVSKTGVGTTTTETDAQSQDKIDAAIKAAETVQIRDAEEDTFLFPSTVRDEEPLSDKTPPSPTETTDFLQPREVQPVRDVEPISDDKTPPSLTETTDFLQPREVQPVRDITPIEPPKDPLPGLTQIKSGVAAFKDLTGTVGQKLAPTETGSSQLYQDLASGLQTSRVAEMYQNLTDGLFSTLESQNKYDKPMGDNEFKASTSISDITKGELPKASDIESYLSSVSDDDDKPKKDRSAKDRRDRRKRAKDLKYDATKALGSSYTGEKGDTGSLKVYRDAEKRGATKKELEKIVKEDKKIEDKLKNMQKGIKQGFAKGGLASRTK